MMKPKPRIIQLGPDKWQCSDADLTRTGKTAKQAYDRWMSAVLHNQAKAKLKRPRQPHQNLTIAKPRKAAPTAAPNYHESVVQQVAGTQPRRKYVPPALMRLNGQRAALFQKPMITPNGVGNYREYSKETER